MTVPANTAPSSPATPLWRWSVACLLVSFVALLSNGVLLAQTPSERLEQELVVGDTHWVVASHQELLASTKRLLSGGPAEPDTPTFSFPDFQPALWLLLAGFLLAGLRHYFRAQTRLIPLRTNSAPLSPRAPPA